MTPKVIRKAEGSAREMARAEDVALALMGVGPLPSELIAPDATWQRSDAAPAAGRAAIVRTFEKLIAPDTITVEQVVAQGTAASVSGRLTRGKQSRIFCHVIRHTTAQATEIAQIVSFEHRGEK
ncbi:SnoaL-like protein [Pacificibacter maritimus]|uniref:SnoaL-like protein n=1 Tax=Pacificibacter maritimus TaxID=762213 RepID=A0A3N4VGM4_9RHOB|nr:nuclear transport factor 2 family protein [Pacificibacter maritimus]RPE72084.1 SnoaL-like protein [Pacificibacter maritimus]